MEKLLKRKNENMYNTHNSYLYADSKPNDIIHCRVQTQLHIIFVETQKDNT